MKKWQILIASMACASAEGSFFNSRDEPVNLAQEENMAEFKLHSTPASCPLAKKQMDDPLVKYLDNTLFLTDIEVGNPPQKIRALLDTGSTNMWVLNKKTMLGKGELA